MSVCDSMNMLYLLVEETEIVRLIGGICMSYSQGKAECMEKLVKCVMGDMMNVKGTDVDSCRFSVKNNFKDQRSLPLLRDTLT